MKRIWIAVIMLLAWTANAFAGFVTMKPGEWRITATTKMPGLPYPIPPVSRTMCYSSADVHGNRAIPAAAKGCELKNYHITGASMTWSMVCKNNVTINGEMMSTGTTYQARMTSEEQGRTIITHVTGKREGPCH